MKSREHSGRYPPYRAPQLNDTPGPILQKEYAIIELDQTDAIVTRQVRKSNCRSSKSSTLWQQRKKRQPLALHQPALDAGSSRPVCAAPSSNTKVVPRQSFDELTAGVTLNGSNTSAVLQK
jgi:hypothetical protein